MLDALVVTIDVAEYCFKMILDLNIISFFKTVIDNMAIPGQVS